MLDILTIAICAVICGADSWVYVEMFGKSKEEWFRSFLDLPNGIPSHDTFGDVFSRLDPDRFQECFMEWSQAVADLLPRQCLGCGQHPDPGASEDGSEIQCLRRLTGATGYQWLTSAV